MKKLGRPKKDNPKIHVTLRIDSDAHEYLEYIFGSVQKGIDKVLRDYIEQVRKDIFQKKTKLVKEFEKLL